MLLWGKPQRYRCSVADFMFARVLDNETIGSLSDPGRYVLHPIAVSGMNAHVWPDWSEADLRGRTHARGILHHTQFLSLDVTFIYKGSYFLNVCSFNFLSILFP